MNSAKGTKLIFFFNIVFSFFLFLNSGSFLQVFPNRTVNATETSDKNIQHLLKALAIPQLDDSRNNVERVHSNNLDRSRMICCRYGDGPKIID